MTFEEAKAEKEKHLYLLDGTFVEALITDLVVVPANAPYDLNKKIIVNRITKHTVIDESMPNFNDYKVLVICAEHYYVRNYYWNYDLSWVLGQRSLNLEYS